MLRAMEGGGVYDHHNEYFESDPPLAEGDKRRTGIHAIIGRIAWRGSLR